VLEDIVWVRDAAGWRGVPFDYARLTPRLLRITTEWLADVRDDGDVRKALNREAREGCEKGAKKV